MNRYFCRFMYSVCIVMLGVLHTAPMRAGASSLGTMAISALASVKNMLPSKTMAIATMCGVGALSAKALWTRYVTLKRIDLEINPEVLLYIDQRRHPIYNWMMGAPGFTTPAQIRENYQNVKAALVIACLSEQVDIFQRHTGIHLVAGQNMYWGDVMSTIDGEMARIRRMMRGLESFVDISFRGIHLFGIRKNFARVCSDLGITGLDQMRHALTVGQEEEIAEIMTQAPSLDERLLALFMANPNYDKACLIFWELDQRLGRLQAIKEAIVYTPVHWNIALH